MIQRRSVFTVRCKRSGDCAVRWRTARAFLSECVNRIDHGRGWGGGVTLPDSASSRLGAEFPSDVLSDSDGVNTTHVDPLAFSTAAIDYWEIIVVKSCTATHAPCTLVCIVFKSDLEFDNVHASCLKIVFFFFFLKDTGLCNMYMSRIL